MRGEHKYTVFLFISIIEQLVLCDLDNIAVRKVLNHQSVGESSCHLIEMLLLQLLVLEESVKEVERFWFPSRLWLFILLNHWSAWCTWLTLILSCSCLSLLNSFFSGSYFFWSGFWRINSNKFLGISLNLY
jgi:hypothetical protein